MGRPRAGAAVPADEGAAAEARCRGRDRTSHPPLQCLTIQGGTTEIARNLVAEQRLGLPKTRKGTPRPPDRAANDRKSKQLLA